jgi:hypothetical protein
VNLVTLIKLYKESAMRITDNIWILHGYFTHEMGASRQDVNEMCGIDENELDKEI